MTHRAEIASLIGRRVDGVHTANPGDVYRDKLGRHWLIIGVCHEPTVIAEQLFNQPFDVPNRQSGGVSGLMWEGFTKLAAQTQPPTPDNKDKPNA